MSRDTVIADIQKHPGGGWRIRIYIVVGIFIFLTATILIIAAWPVITAIAFYLAIAIAIAIGLSILVGLAVLLFVVWHWMRRENAKTRKTEIEAAFITHSQNDVAYMWIGRRLVPVYEPQHQALLSAPAEQDTGLASLDFLTVMTQPKRVFSIVADQQTGKTTLCHYLVEWWMQRDIKPIVIGQKFDAGEYLNCERFGPDNADILTGFEMIRQEAKYRQQLADGGQRFNEMDLQPIFLEDFTGLFSVMDRGELERFVAQALTVYAARGLLLYFIAHSRTKEAFGLSRQGAALKDQMTRLEIIPIYDTNGNIDHGQKEIVCSIGSGSGPLPVTGIPGYQPNLNQKCKLSLYSSGELPLPVEHDTILRMYAAGKNITNIGAAISENGQKGGKQNKRVKQILEKYGIKT